MTDREPCPLCNSPDTARYRWPDDPVTKHYLENTPEARDQRVCMDCRTVFRP